MPGRQIALPLRFLLLSLVAASVVLSFSRAWAGMETGRLRCESLENPLGIDVVKPRLSWALSSIERNQHQSAYQILVAGSIEALAKDSGDLWDSGKVVSSETLYIPYAGQQLLSGQTAYWKVRSWDQDDKPSIWSEPATFEMALLSPDDWKAKWIGQTRDIAAQPAPLLRRELLIPGQIKRARAYVCGLGYYELRINGEKVGNHVLDPGYTRFDKRALYVTYDVTNALKTGANAIGVMLGNGWFNVQTVAVWDFEKAPWRAAPKLLLRLEVETTDGKKLTLVTDENWKTSTGPITFDSLYSGENYDARLEQKDWDVPGFNDFAWAQAIEVSPPGGRLVAQLMPPIRVVKTLKPVKVTEPKPGVFLYDFGQNFAGFPRLTISGAAGTTISMKCGERLNSDGTLDPSAIAVYVDRGKHGQQFQTNIYTLKGGGTETWEPRFTYQGFQYVEVTGAPGTLDAGNLLGLVVHTDVAPVGDFTCSDPLLGRIQEAARWSYLSNLYSIPTDCPQREKNGWTGDAQLACELGLLNYDGVTVYRKWVDDIADEQQPNHKMSVIIPNSGWGYNVFDYAPAWDTAYFEVPWEVYLYTGDAQLLESHYEGYVDYLDWLGKQETKKYILKGGLGDWVPSKTETPGTLTSTAYFYHDAVIASKAAALLGKEDEERKYADLASNIKKAFNAEFFDPKTGLYANGSQTAQSCALYFDLAEPQYRKIVLEKLLSNIAQANDHLDTGILGSKYVLNVLTAYGHTDVAYRIANQKTSPSWGWWIEQGATTLWEQWDGNASRNHIMFGEIEAWFYKALAGINVDPSDPGFKNIIIRPNPVQGLAFANGRYDSARGVIESNWRMDGSVFTLNLIIPANTTATVHIPASETASILEGGKSVDRAKGVTLKQRTADEAVFQVGSGHYSFGVH